MGIASILPIPAHLHLEHALSSLSVNPNPTQSLMFNSNVVPSNKLSFIPQVISPVSQLPLKPFFWHMIIITLFHEHLDLSFIY